MQKVKKNTLTSKKARPEGVLIPGTKERIKREYRGQDPRKVIDVGPDKEVPKVSAEVEAELKKMKFPPPSNHPIFIRIWNDFVDNIASRENFKTGHLNSLEILCDLYVEYDKLKKYVEKNGDTYKSIGRSGVTWNFYPQVKQLKIVQSSIREYMKMLGLILKKDHDTASGGEKSEWS